MKPDHNAIMHSLRKEVTEILVEHGGRPPGRRIYALRQKKKRRHKELERFEKQLVEIERDGKSSGGYRDPSYSRQQVRELKEKLEEIEKLDLMTAKEKRGETAKPYTRSPLTEYKVECGLSSLTNEEFVARYVEPQAKMVAERKRADKEYWEAVDAAPPGSPLRREAYEKRVSVWLPPGRDIEELCQVVAAREALAEKRGVPLPPRSKLEHSMVEFVTSSWAERLAIEEQFADVADGLDVVSKQQAADQMRRYKVEQRIKRMRNRKDTATTITSKDNK